MSIFDYVVANSKLPEPRGKISDSIEGLDDIIKIQVAEPSNKTDDYMRGLSNGLLTAKAIVTDDQEPVKLMGRDGKMDEAYDMSLFQFQDEHQEHVIHSRWSKGNVYAGQLMHAGDIFRELCLERPMLSYVDEKIKRLIGYFERYENQSAYFNSGKMSDKYRQEFIKDYGLDPRKTGIHPEDSYEYSLMHNKDKFDALRKYWTEQPVKTELQKTAKELNLAMLDKDFDKVRQLLRKIEAGFGGKSSLMNEAAVLKYQKAPLGLWQYCNGKIAITGGMRTPGLSSTSTHAKLRFFVFDYETEKRIGQIDLSWNYKEQKPDGIVDLKIEKDQRGKGWGEEVVQSLKMTFPGMKVYDIKKSAVGFWKKQGAVGVPTTTGRSQQDAQLESANEEVVTHEHSNTQIPVPHEIAEEVVQFGMSIPDEEIYTDPDDPSMGRELTPHITIKWGLLTEDPNEVESLIEDDAEQFTVTLGKVSIFSKEDKPYDVVKVDVESEELNKLHNKFSSLKNDDENPEYAPHMTIAYVVKGAGQKYIGRTEFEGKEFVVDCFDFKDQHGNSKQLILNNSGGNLNGY